MTKGVHSFPIRVYYEDTDAAGVVYHSNYLNFAERARTEALRLSGFDQSDMLSDHKTGFAVRHIDVEFLKPAMLDDLLTIETRLGDISRVSFKMLQTIRRGEDVLVELAVKIVVVNDKMRLAKLPESVKKAMLKLFNH